MALRTISPNRITAPTAAHAAGLSSPTTNRMPYPIWASRLVLPSLAAYPLLVIIMGAKHRGNQMAAKPLAPKCSCKAPKQKSAMQMPTMKIT